MNHREFVRELQQLEDYIQSERYREIHYSSFESESFLAQVLLTEFSRLRIQNQDTNHPDPLLKSTFLKIIDAVLVETKPFDAPRLQQRAEIKKPRVSADSFLLTISFTHAASITNVVELKRWAGNLHDIMRGIVMASNNAPETVKLLRTSPGSVIIDLAVLLVSVKLTVAIVKQCMQVARERLELLAKAEEVRSLKLWNDSFETIAESINEAARSGAPEETQIANTIPNFNRFSPEKQMLLESSMKNLTDFFTRGGTAKIDVSKNKLRQQKLGSKAAKQLATDIQEIQQLEQEIHKKARTLGLKEQPLIQDKSEKPKAKKRASSKKRPATKR